MFYKVEHKHVRCVYPWDEGLRKTFYKQGDIRNGLEGWLHIASSLLLYLFASFISTSLWPFGGKGLSFIILVIAVWEWCVEYSKYRNMACVSQSKLNRKIPIWVRCPVFICFLKFHTFPFIFMVCKINFDLAMDVFSWIFKKTMSVISLTLLLILRRVDLLQMSCVTLWFKWGFDGHWHLCEIQYSTTQCIFKAWDRMQYILFTILANVSRYSTISDINKRY